MIGAIIGDIVGSRYEFDMSPKTKEFPLFSRECMFTDDTVMTVAVADALLGLDRNADEKATKDALILSLKKWGRRFPNAGYGSTFYAWMRSEISEPYNSWGNGSAMRVSSAGWLYDTLDRTREVARWTAEITHNHPEGIKGAECVAAVIFLARNGTDKASIKEYVINNFGYDLSKTCDEIRPDYHFDVSCQGTVPVAITAFLEGKDFEDVLRTAVSLGGDCDTLTDIACAMAEGCYEIPEHIEQEAVKRLHKAMVMVIDSFRKNVFEH